MNEKEINKEQFRQYLYEQIPLSKAMELDVVEATEERVEFSAPLGPNMNHRSTAFGGSVSTLAIFSAWTLVHVRLRNRGINCRLVIHRNSMKYNAPVTDTFTAVCSFNDTEAWDRFMRTYERRKRARISVTSVLYCQGKEVANFSGDFVAM